MAASLPFEFRRVRDFGQLLSGLIEFLRGNWKNLSKSLIFIAGPLLLIFGVAGGSLWNEIYSLVQQRPIDPLNFTENIQWFIIGEVIVLMAAYFLAGASVLAVTNEYILMSMGDEMENFSVSVLWGKISARIGSHLATFITVNGLLVCVAVILALVMGILSFVVGFDGGIFVLVFVVGMPLMIYLLIVLSLFPAIRVIENRGIADAIGRSFFLMKNFVMASMGLYIVTFIIQFIIELLFTIPFYIFQIIATITSLPEVGEAANGTPEFGPLFKFAFAISGVFSVAAGLLLNTMPVTVHTLQYFNLVERKEGVGMMAKLDLIGKADEDTVSDEHIEGY